MTRWLGTCVVAAVLAVAGCDGEDWFGTGTDVVGGGGTDAVASDRQVVGRVQFEYRSAEMGEDDQIALSGLRSAPGLLLQVGVVDGDGNVLGEGFVTSDDGSFAIPLSSPLVGGESVVFVPYLAFGEQPVLAVLRPEEEGEAEPAEGTVPVWAWSYPVDASGALGDITIREEDGSGAAYLYVVAAVGLVTVYEDLVNEDASKMVSLAILWKDGLAWSCGACAAEATQTMPEGPTFRHSVFMGGEEGGPSGWADSVLLHEVGHYVAAHYSRDDSPGGPHTLGEPIPPAFAWSEGWASFFSLFTLSRWMEEPFPLYWDIQGGSSFWIDYSRALYNDGSAMVRPDPFGSLDQDLDENYVAAMLWDLWDGADVAEIGSDDGTALGTPRVLAALASERFLEYNRGADGVDFVDFVDAVLCASGELVEPVSRTVSDVLQFPYDGQPGCP